MISIANIRSQLKTVISNLTTSTSATVAFVYDYYKPDIDGYPAIAFDITSNNDSFLTNKENLIRIGFTAYILVKVAPNGLSASKDRLDVITDALIVELRKESNMTLGGYADWITPAVGPRNETETPEGQCLSQQLDIIVNASGFVN